MINIGFLHSVAAIGGAERVTEALIKNLPSSRFESTLFTPETGELTETIKQYGAKDARLNFNQPSWKTPWKAWAGAREWERKLTSFSVDLIHTTDLQSTRSVLLGSGKRPILCHIHFPFSEEYARWIFNRLPKPDAFVFCSHELKSDVGSYVKKYCPTSKQFVVHNGIDPDSLDSEQPNNKVKKIGIIANLQKRKGHDDFLHMAKIVSEKHPNVHFDIIGGDILQEPREAFLKALTRELGLSNKVTFHGQVPCVKNKLESLDIYVCASHQEAFPISNLEAMAAARPIVSTDVNGIPEAIENGSTGLLVPKNEPEIMAEKVIYLLDNPERSAELGKKAREHVQKNFSQKVFTDKFEKIYIELLG